MRLKLTCCIIYRRMPFNTFLVDPTNPNEQPIPEQQPIIWTSGRIYEFFTEANISANKAAWYKSTNGGITWTQPDIANASVCHAFSDWMQVANLAYMLIIANSGGTQSPRLQTFDLNAETYSAAFSTISPPVERFIGPVRIAVMANGKIIIVYATPSVGPDSRCRFAIYDPGSNTWPVGTTDIGTNIVTNFTQWETVIPDPANNLIHVYYSDSASTFCYRQIKSDGTLGTITTFSGGAFNNIHIGNLNSGRAFSTGFLDGTNLVTPVFTRVASIFSLNVITGTPNTSATPTFTISPAIDTASSSVVGQDIGQMIAFNNGGVYSVLYFIGDGSNLYNLVKLATFNGSVWSTTTIYDATADPNAAKNISNNQWLNAISGGPGSTVGSFAFQVATWGTLPGQTFQNTISLTTLVGVAPTGVALINSNTGGGWFFGQKGLILMRIVLPDPKICKSPAQLNRKQWQKGFTVCEK